jgi:hypothetical protein
LKFDVAEIALEAALNNEQTDHLLDICCHLSYPIYPRFSSGLQNPDPVRSNPQICF